MARPRTRTPNGQQQQHQAPPAADVLLLNGEADDEPPELDTALDRLAAAIEAHGDDAKAVVKIYRIPEDGKNLNAGLIWCEDLQPDYFERSGYARIREKWGAGLYRIRLMGTVIGKGGRPGFGIRAQELVAIAQDMSAPATAAPAIAAPGAAAAPPAPGLEAALASIAETQRSLLEALGRQQQQANPMQQMLQMMTLAKAMRDAFGVGDGGHKGGGVLEVLKEMRALKELGGDLLGGPQAEPPDMLTAALPQLLELVREAGKTSRTQQPQLGAPGGAGQVPAVSLPASIPEAPMATGESTMPDVDDPQQLLQMLTKNLNALVALASSQQDPEIGATIVYENLPDELLEVLKTDAWFDQLAAIAPTVQPHREWLDQVRTIVLEWIAEDEKDDGTDNATGNAAAA